MSTPAPTLNDSKFEEIEITEILRCIWKQRVTVLLFSSIGLFSALTYVLLASPVYQISTSIRPVGIADLDELNGSGLYKMSPLESLQSVGSAMESYDAQLKFFMGHTKYLAPFEAVDAPIEKAFETFKKNSAFTLKQIDSTKSSSLTDSIELTFTYPKGIDGVGIVNSFTSFIIENEKNKIEENLKTLISNRIEKIEKDIDFYKVSYEVNTNADIAKLLEQDEIKKRNLQDEMEALRKQVQTRRQNRIKELDEAITIAKQLGISKPSTPSSLAQFDNNQAGNTIRTEVNNQHIPLYFMGQLALQAERSALAARRSDDFTEPRIDQIQKELNLLASNREVGALKNREAPELFIKGIRDSRADLARLKNLAINFEQLQLVRVDKPASEPLAPIRPRKGLIVSLGLFLGFVLGGALALSRGLTDRYKRD